MTRTARLAFLAAAIALPAAAFTVDLAGPRAESPLEFMINQNRKAKPAHQRPSTGIFGLFDFFEFRDGAPQTERASAPMNRVVCKRVCDGAQLVLGIVPERDSVREAAAMCTAAGRGAATELVFERFVPGEGFPVPQLVASAPLQEGRAALDPSAKPAAAPCPKRNEFMSVPILHDATLRKGDVVAMKDGFRVFVGSGRPPFSEKDFRPIEMRAKTASGSQPLRTAGP